MSELDPGDDTEPAEPPRVLDAPTRSSLPFPIADSTAVPSEIPLLPSGSSAVPAPALPPAVTQQPTPCRGPMTAGAGEEPATSFVPLRSDPPPRLRATWWMRYLLVVSMFVGIGAVVMTEYAIGPGGVADAPVVIAPHLLAAVLLVAWTVCAMFDADRLVPATRYHRGSSGMLAAVLWIVAFAAPFGFVAVFTRARSQFDDPDGDLAAVAVAIAAGVVAAVLVWLPFGYLSGQARRIGAPHRVMLLWFVGSVLAAVGSAAIVVIGLHELLADAGLTAAERALQTAVVYGVPAFVFALSTWRATTVFDEVIDLRWGRWRSEWETTLSELASQPAPGPELASHPPES